MVRFESLPRVVRQAGLTWVAWRNRRLRFGDEYRQWSQMLIESNDWEAAARRKWQQEKLIKLTNWACRQTAYYKSLNIDDAALSSAGSLRGALNLLPVLEKNELRTQPAAFRNEDVKESAVTSTSGTTGAPMQVGHDAVSIQRRFAFLHDHIQRAGVGPDAPSVRLSGRLLCKVGQTHAKPWLVNPLENQLFLSSYHLDDSHGQAVGKKLVSFQPQLMDGYPSGILETLRLLDRHGIRLPSLRAIITTAETLHPDMREELESLSGAVVMDYYAASEGVPFIQQCAHGTYHVRWQSGIFEVDTGQEIGFEGDGELICTSFVQDRTPLLRYRTGDLVKGLQLDPENICGCGLRTSTVDQVVGRVEDLVYTPDGRALGMFTYRTLKLIPGLGDTQVIQKNYGDFEVNTVGQSGLKAEQLAAEIKASFERALGYPITFKLNVVEQLPRGANGKIRLVMSKVARKAASA